MITLTAKINLISGNNGDLSMGSTPNMYKNNISKYLVETIVGKKDIKNPFILGSSKLGGGDTFEDSVDYFISEWLYSKTEEGFVRYYEGKRYITGSLLFILSGNVKSLTIAFDTLNDRHPNTIQVDGVKYYDDDAIFTITNLQELENHSISILDWNTDNSPVVISGIYVSVDIDIDNRNLISLNRSILDRSDVKLPSFGIISNTGNIEFNDLNGEVKDYAEQLLLTSDLKVKISLNNTLSNTSQEIGVFETRDWDYNNDNRSVSVSLKDDLEEWQDINVEGFGYDAKNRPEYNLAWFYKELHSKTPQKYNMLAFYNLDSATQEVLNNIKIKYPMLNSGSLWEQWTKICEVAQAHIYKLDNGTTTFVYKGGN